MHVYKYTYAHCTITLLNVFINPHNSPIKKAEVALFIQFAASDWSWESSFDFSTAEVWLKHDSVIENSL